MKATGEQQPAEDKAWEDLTSKNSRVQRRIYWGTAVATVVVIIVVVAVILALVVFKIRDPTLSVSSMKVREVNFIYDSGRQKLHLNATLELRISVRNPNRASFKFRNGTTLVYYTGKTVGVGVISAGKLPADSTVNLTSVVRVVADGLLSNSYLLTKALSGSLNFSTSTRISGRVNVLNIYKHHAVSNAFCNLTVAVSKQRVESQQCIYSIKL